MIRLSDVFACDRRSLAITRFLLAFAVLLSAGSGPWAWLTVTAAAALALGWRTSLATLTCWLLIAFEAGGASGEPLLIALLVVGVFLPLGAHCSIDAALDSAHAPGAAPIDGDSGHRISGVESLALTVLTLFVAIRTGLNTDAGTAKGLTKIALLFAPLAVIVPLAGGWLRAAAVLVLLLASAALAVEGAQAAKLVAFAAALLGLLPGTLWDALASMRRVARRRELRIFFDLDCGFCRKTCYLFRSFLLLGDAPIRPAQENAEAYAIMQEHVTWVVYDYDGRACMRWHAVVLLLRRSPLFGPLGALLHVLGMGRWGDPLYAGIAASRWWLSRLTAVVLPWRRERPPAGRIVSAMLAVWIAALVLLSAVPEELADDPGPAVATLFDKAGLVQRGLRH